MNETWGFPMELSTWLRLVGPQKCHDAILGINQANFLYEDIVPIFGDGVSSQTGTVAQVIGMFQPEGTHSFYPIFELNLSQFEVVLTLLYASGRWAVSVNSAKPLQLSQDIYEHISGDPLLSSGMPIDRYYAHYIRNQQQFSFIVNGSYSLKLIMSTFQKCICN